MAEEKATKATRRTAKTKAAVSASEEKKVSAAKAAEKKKTTRKTADKPKAKTEKAPRAAKTAGARTGRAKKPVRTAIVLDDLTTAVWKNIEHKDVAEVPGAIAIQVNVFDTGIFYIAIKANPDESKQVMQSDYYLADGIVDTSAEEVLKIAKGDYDFVEAVKAGRLNYRGDLSKAVRLAGILKSDAKLEIVTEKSSD